MKLLYEDLEKAYLRAIKGKSAQKQVIARNANLESNMKKLYNDLIHDKYHIGPCTRCIIQESVPREIIIIPFRDRIVQHLLYGYIYPYFDKRFIYDSYSNRNGRGTLAAIKRADYFMRSCSDNYTRDCYIMKLDVQSFFVSIDRDILGGLVYKYIYRFDFYSDSMDIRGIFGLLYHIIYHNYTFDLQDNATSTDNLLIPRHKSILYAPINKGLPLGNLTSQLFANMYMHELDLYIKHKLKIKYYIRYADDFLIYHVDHNYLLDCKNKIQSFLLSFLKLKLHPDKIYIQHYTKGVNFLGIYILPYCRLPGQRILSGLSKSLNGHSKQSIMSYRGLISHHNSYKYISTIDQKLANMI